jgi:hypothetical protein
MRAALSVVESGSAIGTPNMQRIGERNRAAVLGFRRRSAFRYPEDPFVGTRAHNQSPHRVAGEKKVGMMLGYG